MPVYARTAQALSVARGERLTLEFTADATVEDPSVSGWALAFVVRPTPADLDDPATYSRTTGNGGVTVTDAAAGEFEATLTKAQTLALPVGPYDWELWRTDADAETRLAFGKLTVTRSVQYPT